MNRTDFQIQTKLDENTEAQITAIIALLGTRYGLKESEESDALIIALTKLAEKARIGALVQHLPEGTSLRHVGKNYWRVHNDGRVVDVVTSGFNETEALARMYYQKKEKK